MTHQVVVEHPTETGRQAVCQDCAWNGPVRPVGFAAARDAERHALRSIYGIGAGEEQR